jgi:protease-4
MLLRLVLFPIVLLLRLLSWPLVVMRRRRACPEGALIEITLRGEVPESPPRPARRWSIARLLRRTRPAARLHLTQLRKAIDEAIADARVGGVLVRIDGAGLGGWASLEALRAELWRVRAAGKKLVAFLPNGGGNRVIYLATAAKTIVAPPTADVLLTGIKSDRMFLKKTLDHVGVEFELHARKEYKSAADGFTREDRSPGDREQTEVLVAAMERALVGAIAEGREIDEEKARGIVDAGPTRASVACERGLFDHVAYDDDLPTLLGAPIADAGRWYVRRRAGRDRRPLFSRKKIIAVVEVHGAIASTRSPFARALGQVADADQVVADLRAAERDPRVAGVVLDVDSRGGTVTASDLIHAAAKRLAAKKPVVARMANVAASGGYYVAAAAKTIVARPTTITGSIGVVAARPIFARIADRLGVKRDVISAAKFADLDAVTRAPTDDERALFAREIDGHYQSFVQIVAGARGRPFDEIEPLARGRVWTGSDAHQRGLVDHLGGFDRAVQLVRDQLPGVAIEDDARVIAASVPSRRLDDRPQPRAAIVDALAELLPDEIRALAAPLLLFPARVLAWMP